MATKQLKDYLHLYLGCRCKGNEGSMVYELIDVGKERSSLLLDSFGNECVIFDFKPILRPLSDMTEDDLDDIGRLYLDEDDLAQPLSKHFANYESFLSLCGDLSPCEMAELTTILLSKNFDLFGLIEAGLAIDKTSIN